MIITTKNYQICYRVVINAIEPASMTNVYVNANTGEVFTSQSATYDDYAVTGTLWTWYNGWHVDRSASGVETSSQLLWARCFFALGCLHSTK